MQATLVLNQQFKIFQRGENCSLSVTDKSKKNKINGDICMYK
jgi:hypothetical protein